MSTHKRSAGVIVAGAGHNGLVASAYLAKAGLDVLVVEASPTIGVSPPTYKRRTRSSGCRATRRRTSSPAAASPTTWTSKTSSTPGSPRSRPHPQDAPRAAGRSARRGAPGDGPVAAGDVDTTKRWVTRIPPDPHLRIDTNDYSLDPKLVGRRVEVRADQRQILAVVLDTGEVACEHQRVFAKHRTIIALEHARALRDGRAPAETSVEVRPLARYDALIA